jgi:hypothetical protein
VHSSTASPPRRTPLEHQTQRRSARYLATPRPVSVSIVLALRCWESRDGRGQTPTAVGRRSPAGTGKAAYSVPSYSVALAPRFQTVADPGSRMGGGAAGDHFASSGIMWTSPAVNRVASPNALSEGLQGAATRWAEVLAGNRGRALQGQRRGPVAVGTNLDQSGVAPRSSSEPPPKTSV